jgi:hypothetical protein
VKAKLAAVLPSEAPCHESFTATAAKTPGPPPRRIAAAVKTPVTAAERKGARSETKGGKTRDKGEKGAIQLAAASKKDRKRKGSHH